MGKRIEYIDAIRGFAIILVVMAHAIAWNYPDWHKICLFNQTQPVNIMAGGVVWQVIYSFHMALFFMVSGYLSGNITINAQNIYTRIKGKTIRLLLPYLTTGFFIYLVRGNWGYWFLLSLFEMSVLWIIMAMTLSLINPNKAFWKDILFILCIYGLLRFLLLILPLSFRDINFGAFIKYYLPFCFGVITKRHMIIEDIIRKPICFTICLISFILLFITRYLTDYPLIYKVVEKADFFCSILAILACTVVFHIFMKGILKKKEQFFAYIGKVSLPIYILHIVFVMQFSSVGLYILQQNVVTSITFQIVYSILLTIVAITCSIMLYKFLCYSKIIRLFFFGEKIE